jgi:transcriptional regulator with XRE-family HTH domain
MGRPEEPLRRDGSPEREFAFWLRDLRNQAGLTYERLAHAANYSTSTMQAAAAGRQLPTYKVTMAFVRACGGDEAAWSAYWRQVKRALDNDRPSGTQWPARPPWVPAEETEPPLPAAAGTTPNRHGPPGPRHPGGENGWYVHSFTALLRMDTAQPEATEDRVIVATVDGLTELVTSVSIPRHPGDSSPVHELGAELLYGGRLERVEQPFESHFRNVIVLARPLRKGERHRYLLRLRVPAGQRMVPHYVHVPFQRTDHFELKVRFGPGHLPREIWALSGTPPHLIYEPGRGRDALVPDRFGEITVEFRDLGVGRAYGVRWQE